MGQTAAESDELGQAVTLAAESFCKTTNVSPTKKRLLYEYLSLLAWPNNVTLRGLSKPGIEVQPGARADVLCLTRKWMGKFVLKHYYVMRQFEEATGVVLDFLQFLRSEASLPAVFKAELDAAIEVAQQGCEQLPHIMRIMRQPDVLNEAYAFRYPLRPWPLAHVPATTVVKETSSRCWPSNNKQNFHSWLSFTSERCRLEPDKLLEVLDQVPVKLSVVNKVEGCWEVEQVRPDHKIDFREWQGSQQFTVQFTAIRAADFVPGMVLSATVVTLSDGTCFMTDWNYVFPTYYVPHLTGKEDWDPYDPVDLVH